MLITGLVKSLSWLPIVHRLGLKAYSLTHKGLWNLPPHRFFSRNNFFFFFWNLGGACHSTATGNTSGNEKDIVPPFTGFEWGRQEPLPQVMTWVASEYITLKSRITKQRTQRTNVCRGGGGEGKDDAFYKTEVARQQEQHLWRLRGEMRPPGLRTKRKTVAWRQTEMEGHGQDTRSGQSAEGGQPRRWLWESGVTWGQAPLQKGTERM